MKLNTKTSIKSLKGEDLKNDQGEVFTIGEALGNIMIHTKMEGKMKCYILAQKFATLKEVELDAADLALVKSAVDSSEAYSLLVLGAVLVALEK